MHYWSSCLAVSGTPARATESIICIARNRLFWVLKLLMVKQLIKSAVVVAQLVERSFLIPEVRGSKPVIGKNLFIHIQHLFTVNCVLKRRK